jgi:uncharacterized membrane protein (UPF0127 family)
MVPGWDVDSGDRVVDRCAPGCPAAIPDASAEGERIPEGAQRRAAAAGDREREEQTEAGPLHRGRDAALRSDIPDAIDGGLPTRSTRCYAAAMRIAACGCLLLACGPAATSRNNAVVHPSTLAEISPEVVLEPPGADPVHVTVEVARTPSTRRRGLMFRRHLAPIAGMLFVFERPAPRTFWMRNTFLRLDMIFIGADRHVVGVVADATPLTDDPRAVDADSQYVLEVRAGFASEHGVVPGTLARFVGVSEE